ncbi:MAG: rRNA pseudouridine synthase, partial [Synergistaceae bacterium]|nr:rRNA pseudouridine synthase [Synergistaceae bacterium]
YRLFPVGRLDRESVGLLVLTNDGDFAQELLHPSKSVLREYEVLLSGEITRRDVRLWMGGVLLDGRLLKPLNLLIMDKEPASRWISIVLGEGVKREVRRMAEAFDFSVEMLIRRRIGKMELRDLPAGEYREMSRHSLWRAIRSGGTV